MDKLKQELIDAVVEISMSTGMTTYECIQYAKEILGDNKTNYIRNIYLQMFSKW